jgi:hypothetical protein
MFDRVLYTLRCLTQIPRAAEVTCDKIFQAQISGFFDDVLVLVTFEAEAQQKGRHEPSILTNY